MVMGSVMPMLLADEVSAVKPATKIMKNFLVLVVVMK